MKRSVFHTALFGVVLLAPMGLGFAATDPLDDIANRLVAEIAKGQAYTDLKELTSMGHRLTGSPGAARAVQWAADKMKAYGFTNITLQPVTVPHWERGKVESAELVSSMGRVPLAVTALGGSIGTPAGGIEAPVVRVQSLDDVDRLGAQVQGKIVFYDVPMDPYASDTFEAYGKVVGMRFDGAAAAAKYGAAGTLIRSISTLTDDDHPHTGIMHYSSTGKIPAGALSTHAANVLASALSTNPDLHVKLVLSARDLGVTKSYNVFADLKGSEKPDEIVLVGGHLDSWDLGTGAQDDGTGVVTSIEVARAIHALGLQPKRTIRVVLFMAEEFGGIGADEYARQAKRRAEKHIVALEADRGAFQPKGFERDPESAGGNVLTTVQPWTSYLQPVNAAVITDGSSGTDVEPLNDVAATFGYVPDSTHYFDYHHSALDQIDAVNPYDLNMSAAAMAIFTFVAAEKGL